MKLFPARNKVRTILALSFLPVLFGSEIPLAVSQEESNSISNDWVNLSNGDEIGRYFRKNNQIHVHVNGMISEELQNADSVSFRVNKKFSEFGRDKAHIWFVAAELQADKPTWEVISQSYSKDRANVYNGARELPGADPNTFKILRGGLAEWGADKSSVYNQWFKLEDSDPLTFQFIGDSFSKDNKNVYHYQNRLDGADPNTFEIIKPNVGKDKSSIFAFGKRMPSYIDMSSVRVPGDGYIYDKNGRYCLHKGEWVKEEATTATTSDR